MKTKLLWISLIALIVAHAVLIVANLIAMVILPFYAPWYIASPLIVFLVLHSTSTNWDCPLTNLENLIKQKLGIKPIDGFIQHYMFNPIGSFVLAYLRTEERKAENVPGTAFSFTDLPPSTAGEHKADTSEGEDILLSSGDDISSVSCNTNGFAGKAKHIP